MTSIRSVSDASDNASEMKKLMPSLHRKMSYQDEDIELNYLIRGKKEQEQEGTVMETTKKVTTPVAFATLVTFCVVLLLFSFSSTSSTANTGMVSLDSLRVNDVSKLKIYVIYIQVQVQGNSKKKTTEGFSHKLYILPAPLMNTCDA